jgi:hypothetical protein
MDLMKQVRATTTADERKAAWTHKDGRCQWEFFGPRDFYWYGYATSAADARRQGWTAWLESNTSKIEG